MATHSYLIAAVLVLFQDNKVVESIDLEDNWIGASGASSIAQLLRTNRVLTEIVSRGICRSVSRARFVYKTLCCIELSARWCVSIPLAVCRWEWGTIRTDRDN